MYCIEKSLFLFSIFALMPMNLLSSDSIKTTIHHRIEKVKSRSYISTDYFKKKLRCSPSCGVAIKGWYNAKKYCSEQNGLLVSETEIKKSINIKDRKGACLDCSYWTSREFIPKKRKKNQKKEVYIYLNFEDDLLKYSINGVYIATCLVK